MVGKVREDGELEAGMSGSWVRAGLWRERLYTEKVRDACADCLRVLTRDGVFMRIMSICARMHECMCVLVHVCMRVLTCTRRRACS